MGVDTAHLQHQPKTMIAFRGWPRAIILALAQRKASLFADWAKDPNRGRHDREGGDR
jgi:hypothetical protein